MTHPDAPGDIRGLERIWPEPGFLSLDEQGVDVVEKPRRLSVARRGGDVLGVAGEIADHFIAAVDPNG